MANTDLRERLARALCRIDGGTPSEWPTYLPNADAVIRELGLTQAAKPKMCAAPYLIGGGGEPLSFGDSVSVYLASDVDAQPSPCSGATEQATLVASAEDIKHVDWVMSERADDEVFADVAANRKELFKAAQEAARESA